MEKALEKLAEQILSFDEKKFQIILGGTFPGGSNHHQYYSKFKGLSRGYIQYITGQKTYNEFVSQDTSLGAVRIDSILTANYITANTLPTSATASSKLPVISAIAVINKFPNVCPLRPAPEENRYWKI
jgi:hypothetical protein